MQIQIREAEPHETKRLSEIAQRAKRCWDYPEEYFRIWKEELTITEEYIRENIVFVAEACEQIIGFYSLVNIPNDCSFGIVSVEKGFWMDHLFIDPLFQYQSIGTKLVHHATTYCRTKRIIHLKLFADPNAVGFYEKLGARFVRTSLSSIPGREIPVYEFQIDEEEQT